MTETTQQDIAAGSAVGVASAGIWKGLHPGMGLAAISMVLVFVVVSVAFLDQAGALYSDIRAWIEAPWTGTTFSPYAPQCSSPCI